MPTQNKTTHLEKFSGKLSLVIPCYNEEHRVTQMIEGLREFHQKYSFDYEVVVVDDGSRDQTAEKIRGDEFIGQLASTGKFQFVQLAANQGKGAALRAGVVAATGTHILTLDADMSARPTEVLKWMASNNDGLPINEIWIASREHPDSEVKVQAARRFTGLMFNLFVRLLTPLPQKDTQCGFKLYPFEIAQKLFAQQESSGWAHDVELLYRAYLHHIPIREFPVTWTNVEGSKLSVTRDSMLMLLNVIRVSRRLKAKTGTIFE